MTTPVGVRGEQAARDFLTRQARVQAALPDGAKPSWATVVTVSGSTVTVRMDGATTAEAEPIPYVSDIVAAGDRGVVLPLKGGGRVFIRAGSPAKDHHIPDNGNANGMQIGAGATVTDRGTAIGNSTQAVDAAIAFGTQAEATGFISMALGWVAKAAGQGAIALGYTTIASALNSIAIGWFSSASADKSIAIGDFASAAYPRSVAIGAGAASTATDQARVHANELALDRSSGAGATTVVLRSPGGAWKRLRINDDNTITVTNA